MKYGDMASQFKAPISSGIVWIPILLSGSVIAEAIVRGTLTKKKGFSLSCIVISVVGFHILSPL